MSNKCKQLAQKLNCMEPSLIPAVEATSSPYSSSTLPTAATSSGTVRAGTSYVRTPIFEGQAAGTSGDRTPIHVSHGGHYEERFEEEIDEEEEDDEEEGSDEHEEIGMSQLPGAPLPTQPDEQVLCS
jgi:hypothetical protein